MKKVFIIFLQLVILWTLNQLGDAIVTFLHIPIPGNIMGMTLLFILLVTGVVKLKWVETTSEFLMKHLTFFFIPISVGLMTLGSVFTQSGISLIFILMISATIGFIGTGLMSEKLLSKRKESAYEHNHHRL